MRARVAGRFLSKRDDIADPRWRGNPTGTFAAGLLLLATACGTEQPVDALRTRDADLRTDEPQFAPDDEPKGRDPLRELFTLMRFGDANLPHDQRAGFPPWGAEAFVEHFSLGAPRAASAHAIFDEVERELRDLWTTPTPDGATWLSYSGFHMDDLLWRPDAFAAVSRESAQRFVQFGKRLVPGFRDGQTYMHRFLALGRAGANRLRTLLTDRQQAEFDRFSGPPAEMFKRPRPEDFE